MEISNPTGAEPLQIFLGAGASMEDEPWVKLLGHNGFIIAKSESEAERVMAKIDERGGKFSYKDFE